MTVTPTPTPTLEAVTDFIFLGSKIIVDGYCSHEIKRCFLLGSTLEKGIATHCSVLAWRIPWTEEPGGLRSIGSQRVKHRTISSCVTGFSAQQRTTKAVWALICPGSDCLVPVLAYCRAPASSSVNGADTAFLLGVPRTEEPGGLQSMGSVTLQAQKTATCQGQIICPMAKKPWDGYIWNLE